MIRRIDTGHLYSSQHLELLITVTIYRELIYLLKWLNPRNMPF
jgi:hypothetical protein